MLTKISATAAAVTAVLNTLVLLSVLSLTADQIAGINVAVVLVGGAIHSWFNPAVPFGSNAPA